MDLCANLSHPPQSFGKLRCLERFPPKTMLEDELWSILDHKTKPPRSLGRLEELAVWVGQMQKTVRPRIAHPTMLIFAADHGIAEESVSAYPQEVTSQMVLNFLQGGAAISALSRLHQWNLKVVDAGVKGHFSAHPNLIDRKIGPGTHNFLHGPAMSLNALDACLKAGAEIVAELHGQGCDLLGLGEMGIANTSSATCLLALLLQKPLSSLVGPGTGVSATGLDHKRQVLQKAVDRHRHNAGQPRGALQAVAGYEMAMMVGAAAEATARNIPLVVDGFIVTAAMVAAIMIQPEIREQCLFSHLSAEPGHRLALDYLQAQPYLQLNLRLGEGTGAALMLPLLRSALAILNEMATFDQAGVAHAVST